MAGMSPSPSSSESRTASSRQSTASCVSPAGPARTGRSAAQRVGWVACRRPRCGRIWPRCQSTPSWTRGKKPWAQRGKMRGCISVQSERKTQEAKVWESTEISRNFSPLLHGFCLCSTPARRPEGCILVHVVCKLPENITRVMAAYLTTHLWFTLLRRWTGSVAFDGASHLRFTENTRNRPIFQTENFLNSFLSYSPPQISLPGCFLFRLRAQSWSNLINSRETGD